MKRALFLDRDGVINEDCGYVYKISDFVFKPGIFDLVRKANDAGYLVVVVTNQAGIARGYYSEADFLLLTAWMLEEFHKNNSYIDKVYYCPYHPVHGLGKYKKDSDLRKPSPGMLLNAEVELGIDMGNSLMIGDKESDVQAGIRAKIGMIYMISNQKSYMSSCNNFNIKCIFDLNSVVF
jgi:D-glycero-D-manno-heptose 1,7-bisphosphate phosphatase